jgi:probable phosphoglycerate mutase
VACVVGCFVLVDHLVYAVAVVLSPFSDGRWSCVQWGSLTPPFYPEPDADPVGDALRSDSDPMG